MKYEHRIRTSLHDLAGLANQLAEQAETMARIAERYLATLRGGGTLYFAGNGGSAADAQHLATEYVVRFSRDRGPLRAVALTTDTSLLTAAGNDFGFDHVFARQVEALCRPQDLLILHSTSGKSPNLVRAAQVARVNGVPTVALLGRDGGELLPLATEALIVPGQSTARIQELQLAVQHVIADLIDEELAG